MNYCSRGIVKARLLEDKKQTQKKATQWLF